MRRQLRVALGACGVLVLAEAGSLLLLWHPSDSAPGSPAKPSSREDPSANGRQGEVASRQSARFGDLTHAAIPLSERIRRVRSVAAAGDESSADLLIEIASSRTYMNRYAAEALGEFSRSTSRGRVLQYVSNRVADCDPLLAAACIRACGKLGGNDAVVVLIRALRSNASRADALHLVVCTAAVRAIGSSGTRAGAGALLTELTRCGTRGWDIAYGLEVVRALELIGEASAKEPLLRFASRLESLKPDDPLAGGSYDEASREARRVAAQLP